MTLDDIPPDEWTCKPCPECGGTGNVWFSFSGRYLGKTRYDDLDSMETCSECDGSGLLEMCDACRDAEDEEADRG